MAEDHAAEKTEPATPRKRQESRQKGQAAKSQDLTTAILLLSAFCLIFVLAERFMGGLTALYRQVLEGMSEGGITFENVVRFGSSGLVHVMVLTAPLILSLFAVSFLVSLLQVGWVVSFQPLSPDITKLNPIKGASRLFSRRSLMRLCFGILKLVVVAVILYTGYLELFSPASDENALLLMHADLPQVFLLANTAIFHTGARAGMALLVLALLDFAYQRWQHDQDLRMTKQEVREEHKRAEGDPKLRERRRRVSQQLALQRMMHDVPRADVVITNPTHYACAIRYRERERSAPRLLAKGKGHVAHRIREQAIRHEVPVVEEPALARMIYASTEVGQEIPPELYNPVAKVLAYVYRLGKRNREPNPVAG